MGRRAHHSWGRSLAFFLLPSVHMESFSFNPGTVDGAAWRVVLVDFLGMLFNPSDHVTWSHDRMEYYLRIISSVLSVVAHCYFFWTFLIIFIPPASGVGMIARYPALLLIFVWSFPILNCFHPIGVGVWRLEFGFYVMGAGYMLAMFCILWSPMRQELVPAVPGVEGGRYLGLCAYRGMNAALRRRYSAWDGGLGGGGGVESGESGSGGGVRGRRIIRLGRGAF